MAATADQLAALGNDSRFQQRVHSLLIQQAGVVYAEDPAMANHVQRAQYAKQVIAGSVSFGSVAQSLANRPNLVASNITYNFASGDIITDASDAAIQSQIATDWNMLAGL